MLTTAKNINALFCWEKEKTRELLAFLKTSLEYVGIRIAPATFKDDNKILWKYFHKVFSPTCLVGCQITQILLTDIKKCFVEYDYQYDIFGYSGYGNVRDIFEWVFNQNLWFVSSVKAKSRFSRDLLFYVNDSIPNQSN